MKTMFYVELYNTETKESIYKGLYFDLQEFYKDTFSPIVAFDFILDFTVKGKTYKEKKGNLQDLAIEYSNKAGDLNLSYYELSCIQNFFYENGKRYGLLKEFKENCIC